MSSEPTTTERVWIPLGVIIATVSFLFLFGMLLFKSGGSTPETQLPTVSAAPTSDSSASPSSNAGKLPDVIVLNGTDTQGLAKKAAEEISAEGWPVTSTGNWESDKLTESTIFYPKALKADAEALAELTGATIELADAVLAKNALTYVVVK